MIFDKTNLQNKNILKKFTEEQTQSERERGNGKPGAALKWTDYRMLLVCKGNGQITLLMSSY